MDKTWVKHVELVGPLESQFLIGAGALGVGPCRLWIDSNEWRPQGVVMVWCQRLEALFQSISWPFSCCPMIFVGFMWLHIWFMLKFHQVFLICGTSLLFDISSARQRERERERGGGQRENSSTTGSSLISLITDHCDQPSLLYLCDPMWVFGIWVFALL